jgi:3'-5' exoribonuclease
MKKIFVKNIKEDEPIEEQFMIMKKLSQQDEKLIAYIGDKTGDIKAFIPHFGIFLEVGDVIQIKGFLRNNVLIVEDFSRETEFNMANFLPTISRPIEEIMEEIDILSKQIFESEECKQLDQYFFKNKVFLEKFEKGIGGLRQHHNYIGGLAEHTLNVMHLAKSIAERYDCRRKELIVLAAKLHDIGKIEEYFTDGPFSVTMRGEMQGHIVIGVMMLEEAFSAGGNIYSQDFKDRIIGCMVQHHGKVEYGSPKAASLEEAFIVNFADTVDATLNKIQQIKESTEPNTWSPFDRRIGTRLYV